MRLPSTCCKISRKMRKVSAFTGLTNTMRNAPVAAPIHAPKMGMRDVKLMMTDTGRA